MTSPEFLGVQKILVAVLAGILAAGSRASGQTEVPPDSAQCVARLSAPAMDSATVDVNARIASLDHSWALPRSYGELLGLGIRQVLVLPQPLAIESYDAQTIDPRTPPARTTLALRSYLVLTLHRDGRLTNAQVTSGGRNAAFDRAILAAIATLDTSGLLPPPTTIDSAFSGEKKDLQISIVSEPDTSAPLAGDSLQRSKTTLFRMRLPLRAVTKPLRVTPTNKPPHYPNDMRSNGTEGNVMAELLVNPDGTAPLESVDFRWASAREFAQAVYDVVPKWTFSPLEIAGCKVASFVLMPVIFGLNR